MKMTAIAVVAAILSPLSGYAQSSPETSLTIYSTLDSGAVPARQLRQPPGDGSQLPGYAMVRVQRQMTFPEGDSSVRYAELPPLIVPSSIRLDRRDQHSVELLEQRFNPGAMDGGTLLQRAVGRDVEVVNRDNSETIAKGRLLNADNGLVLQQSGGAILVLRDYNSVRLAGLPGNVAETPSVLWQMRSEQAGDYPVDIRYETDGFTWWADYDIDYAVDSGTCKARVRAIANIVNRSGRSYEGADLKLVAGDVHRASEGASAPKMRTAMAQAAPVQRFAEHELSGYHVYHLPRPASLMDGMVAQVPLFPAASGVGCEQSYEYSPTPDAPVGRLQQPILERDFGRSTSAGVQVYLTFRNSKENGLGFPLPAGRLRVNTRDGGQSEFVGEDEIEHTPAGELVRAELGRAFDLVADRVQRDFQVDQERRVMEEEIELQLRNHKSEPVQVNIDEHLARWRQWQIVQSNHAFDKQNASTIRFPLKVPANGEASVRYRVRYTW